MDKTEALLARVIGHLADVFKNKLILKGGMLLRLLNSPRSTQDIDYCWIRTKKRTLFAQEIQSALEKMRGIQVIDTQANSRGIFLTLREEPSTTLAKIEVSVVAALHRSPQPMSTAPLTNRYALKTQIISVMDLSEAFSHKIAAALERDLIRDLYDLTQLEPLASFDIPTLLDRLSQLEIGRTKPQKINPAKTAILLQQRVNKMTEKKIVQELSETIPENQLPGLERVIRSSVVRIIRQLENLDQKKAR